MNSINLIGRLGKDANVRTVGDNTVTSFVVAVDSGFGDNKTTLWFDCNFWGARGERVSEYIRKGERIGVTGELGTREHEGKTYLTVRVSDVTLLGDGAAKPQQQETQRATQQPARQNQRGQAEPQRSAPMPVQNTGLDDGDVPF